MNVIHGSHLNRENVFGIAMKIPIIAYDLNR
ncbi:hypothetical protein BLA29_012041 [Euroglyphus maynei]|uniref:Uncharacterized protein n=1 Tax=Euroglyphus maynei TaxID=6958 RepID=A0A1Y3BLQ5_EURMA|nr:hypothetical protein BLA29_012041 [Euroglyphus maynei]